MRKTRQGSTARSEDFRGGTIDRNIDQCVGQATSFIPRPSVDDRDEMPAVAANIALTGIVESQTVLCGAGFATQIEGAWIEREIGVVEIDR